MSWLYTHVVMPLADPDRCAGLPRRLRAIRNFERLPEKAQRAEQQLRLQRLLQHAYNTVPYYRKQFDEAGFRASDARVDRPLPLPILTRNHLRRALNPLRSNAYKPADLRVAASSGTTSTPVRFHRDAEGVRDKVAIKLRLDAMSGIEAGDSAMMLWSENCGFSRESNWRWRMYEGVFMRRTPVLPGATHPIIREEVLERWRWRYEKERPKILYGRSMVLATFASFLQEHGIHHRPKTVIATGEVLSLRDRRLLQDTFRTMPFVNYGSRDVGMIGAECSEHEGLHFHPWGSYVEFDPIGESQDGPVYRLLVTDLLNYGQPFIRYDTGDCVTLAAQTCSCGSWFPLVDQVLGRFADGAIHANGNVVGSVTLTDPASRAEEVFSPLPIVRLERKTAGRHRSGGVSQRKLSA